MRNKLVFALGAALLIVLAWTLYAQDTAKDPVCGMNVNKATAKYTYDYKGATYYFCSQGCKDSFSKDPEKYLTPAPGGKPAMKGQGMGGGMMGKGMGMMQHGQMGQAGGQGMMMGQCPCMLPDVEKKVENTPTGAVITLSSKNPETVKKIQEHAAMMKDGKCPMMGQAGTGKEDQAGGATCPNPNCPMKKK